MFWFFGRQASELGYLDFVRKHDFYQKSLIKKKKNPNGADLQSIYIYIYKISKDEKKFNQVLN